jgi:hypothetical protein
LQRTKVRALRIGHSHFQGCADALACSLSAFRRRAAGDREGAPGQPVPDRGQESDGGVATGACSFVDMSSTSRRKSTRPARRRRLRPPLFAARDAA